MKNINKKYRALFIMIMFGFILTACGKEKPASAVSVPTTTVQVTETTNTPTSNPTVAPTETPATATPTVSQPTTTPDFTLASDFEFPEEDRKAFKEIEKKCIVPYLNGYSIVEIRVSRTGNRVGDLREYRFVYTCERGGSKATLEYQAVYTEYLYEEGDAIIFNSVTCECMIDGWWEVVCDYEMVRGLTGHLN